MAAAIYRLAQESVTNARRHARHTTRVIVAVTGDADQARLTIDDDGSAGGGRALAGYGLVGMRERVSLPGGKCCSTPNPASKWSARPPTGARRSAWRSGAPTSASSTSECR